MLVTVDTGGTKTMVAQFGQDGTMSNNVTFPTPKSQDDYIALLKETLQKNFSDTPAEALVIALPGIVKDGVAVWCNNLGWKNFDARSAFKDALDNTPVFIENDANLAGLAETRILDPMPISSLYVTISTGIGTGVITNGRIDPGLRYSEGGRALVEFEGKVQEWEDFASGKAIREAYGQYARDITSQNTWLEIADRISRGFLAVVPIIQPDTIIIGGSIGTYFDQYSAPLEAILREKLPPHIPCPTFRAAKHPEEAVIYGCYYYALDYLADL
jgi:predicted NBD/HSP70 family sugar kinase